MVVAYRDQEKRQTMIRCPHCGHGRSSVTGNGDIADDANFTRRRRKCKLCLKNFFTREYTEGDTAVDAEKVRIALSLLSRAQDFLKSSRADYHKNWRKNHS